MELILVIDHNSTVIKELEQHLHGHRYRLITTTSYSKGITYTKSGSPDVIFLGLQETNKESLKTIIDLKKDPISKNIPVIAILGKQETSLMQQSQKFGASDYVTLPIAEEVVLEKIQSVIQLDRNVKADKASSRNTHIVVKQLDAQQTMISFKSGLKKYVLPELRGVFNAEFLNMIMDDDICMDLRDIPFLQSDELLIVEKLIGLFKHKMVALIAGKHLGLILAESELEEKVHLCMSLEEYQIFLKIQREENA
ncbi:MAG: response regulator [Spirochaetota bacterium]